MRFIKATNIDVVNAIATRIVDELNGGKQVLWLVSGGSNVELEVAVMTHVARQADSQLGNLSIMPMDERYGKLGHVDSNSQALRAAGFTPGPAHWVDVLNDNISFTKTVALYEDKLAEAFAKAQIIIGQFGLGSDGHIAGILPGSEACAEDVSSVIGFEWTDYVRLTLTPRALAQINVGYVPAFGVQKETALQRLQKNTESVSQLPARLLYNIPEVYVYNSFIESEA